MIERKHETKLDVEESFQPLFYCMRKSVDNVAKFDRNPTYLEFHNRFVLSYLN